MRLSGIGEILAFLGMRFLLEIITLYEDFLP